MLSRECIGLSRLELVTSKLRSYWFRPCTDNSGTLASSTKADKEIFLDHHIHKYSKELARKKLSRLVRLCSLCNNMIKSGNSWKFFQKLIILKILKLQEKKNTLIKYTTFAVCFWLHIISREKVLRFEYGALQS